MGWHIPLVLSVYQSAVPPTIYLSCLFAFPLLPEKKKKKEIVVLSMCLSLTGPFESAFVKTHPALAQVDTQPRFTA